MDNPSDDPARASASGATAWTPRARSSTRASTSTATATLEAGTYEYYCPVPGHTEGGMKGELTVEYAA